MRFSKRSLEGEILIDHSASPGLTPEQLGGFAPAVGKGEVFESAINTCAHCQAMVVLNPDRTRERGYCSKCDKYLCDACAFRLTVTLTCDSAERRFDRALDEIERFGSSPLLLTRL